MRFMRRLRSSAPYLLMLLPAITFFLVFSYLPMAGVVIAFKRYDYAGGIFGSPWTGLDNFRYLFISGKIFTVVRNTVMYNAAFILIGNTVAIGAAIALSEIGSRSYKRISQAVLLLPHFISWVVVGAFVYNLFSYEFGLVNALVKSAGGQPVNYYGMPGLWVALIVVFYLWKSVGYSSVLYLAAIQAIDREMYEAADIDGASAFQKIARITIPSLTRVIVILVLLSIGQIFRGDFNMFYQIVGNNALTYSVTDVIDTFVTRSLVQTREFGMTSAAAFIQSLLCFTIIMVANRIVRAAEPDYALY